MTWLDALVEIVVGTLVLATVGPALWWLSLKTLEGAEMVVRGAWAVVSRG